MMGIDEESNREQSVFEVGGKPLGGAISSAHMMAETVQEDQLCQRRSFGLAQQIYLSQLFEGDHWSLSQEQILCNDGT